MIETKEAFLAAFQDEAHQSTEYNRDNDDATAPLGLSLETEDFSLWPALLEPFAHPYRIERSIF